MELRSDIQANGVEFNNKTHSPCVVCGSVEIIRLHYGAYTCSGCKAFFRRTFSEKKTYVCLKSNNCNTMKESRNACRACRLQKCLQSGMKKSLIRDEQKPKKACANEEDDSSQAMDDYLFSSRSLDAVPDLQPSSIIDYLNWHRGLNFMTNEHPQWRAEISMDWRPIRPIQPCDISNNWQRSTQYFLEWALLIPEFRQLPSYDQVVLFKKNFQSISWLSRCYRTFEASAENLGIALGNGSYIPLNDIDIGYSKLLPSLARKLKTLVLDSMRKFEIQFEEFWLLKALFLFRKGAQESAFAANICDNATCRILKELSEFINKRYTAMDQEQKTLRISEFSLFHSSLQYCSVMERNIMNMLPADDLAHFRGISIEILKS